MLCTVNTRLAKELPKSESWASEHFEVYARYLNERPLISYALGYLKRHLRECAQVAGIPRLVSQLCEKLTNNPTAYLLENWVASGMVQTLDHERRGHVRDFRNRLLRTATRMKFPRVVEVLLIAGAEVDDSWNGRTSLIVSAENGD
jgi:hypothetical protein